MPTRMEKARFNSAARAEVYRELAVLTQVSPVCDALELLRSRYEDSGDYRAKIVRVWEGRFGCQHVRSEVRSMGIMSAPPLYHIVKDWVPSHELALLADGEIHGNVGAGLEQAAIMAGAMHSARHDLQLGFAIPLSTCAVLLAALIAFWV